jgi:3-hydroxyisobutyrate dehydrogenase-like beta-hydroxyacid dehydrogenase
MKKIAWIGTGVMGNAMVTHLIEAGYQCSLYNRSKEKMMNHQERAIICDSIKDAVKDADIVFTIVGYPKDVEEIYCSDAGIFNHCKKGALCIDMTTSAPSLALNLYNIAESKGIRMLDAPVSGGDIGAKNATLSIMVGGSEDDFNEANEYFKYLGKQITYIGTAGSGQHCKMANQIVVAGNIAAVTEALCYIKSKQLDEKIILQAISGGAAASWQLSNNGPKIIKDDLQPGFYIHHFVKDLRLVCEEAEKNDLDLSVVKEVLKKYEHLVSDGFGLLGTQALIKDYSKD